MRKGGEYLPENDDYWFDAGEDGSQQEAAGAAPQLFVKNYQDTQAVGGGGGRNKRKSGVQGEKLPPVDRRRGKQKKKNQGGRSKLFTALILANNVLEGYGNR